MDEKWEQRRQLSMWALRTETWTREQQLQASGKILLHVTAGGAVFQQVLLTVCQRCH